MDAQRGPSSRKRFPGRDSAMMTRDWEAESAKIGFAIMFLPRAAIDLVTRGSPGAATLPMETCGTCGMQLHAHAYMFCNIYAYMHYILHYMQFYFANSACFHR